MTQREALRGSAELFMTTKELEQKMIEEMRFRELALKRARQNPGVGEGIRQEIEKRKETIGQLETEFEGQWAEWERQFEEGNRAPREQTGAANSGGATDAAFNGALLDPRTDDILYSLAELRYQNQEQRYSTDIMVRDQQGILDKLKKMDQNNYLKALELKKNQNPVLDVNPYIQHNDDIATAQRRAAEEIKYQQDYFTRAEQMSQIMTEQQYLTQQIYANEHWGIPSLQGITYGDGEYFTSR